MVSKPILDISTIDLSKIAITKEEVLKLNAQRYEFEQLDDVVYMDLENLIAIGHKKQTENEFWTRGHIPGRPLMPGVMMIEMAAQTCSILFHKKISSDGSAFFGFAGVDNIRFRGSVTPGSDYYMVVKSTSFRSRLAAFEVQGYVDGKMVFEGNVTGVVI